MEMEFYRESSRAVILLSAALAELALETALKKVLRGGKETATLFDFEAPLGTFSGKVKLAFAMKLFDKKALHDLELIRHLRNGFAPLMPVQLAPI
jgi:mannitol operon repressor